jgi:hypothetical protein
MAGDRKQPRSGGNGSSSRGGGRGGTGAQQPIPAGGRFSDRMRAASPYPPFRTTFLRAFRALGASPAILLLPLLFVGGLWIGLVAVGLEVFPRTLVEAMALPPVSSFYTDWIIPASITGQSLGTLAIIVVITIVRSAVWAVLVGMLLEALEYGTVTMVGVLQGLRAFRTILAVMLASLFAILASIILLPAILGSIGLLVFTFVLAGGIYLLPFAPAAAVRGNLPPAEAFRRSIRAARLPGPRHMVLAVLYFFVVLLLVAFVPGGSIITANPPLAEWIWDLAGTVVQVLFLAAFCERWLAVEDIVPTGPAPRRQPRAPARRR